MTSHRRITRPRPAPEFTRAEAQRILSALLPEGGSFAGAKIDDAFLEEVRVAFEWATTSRGRCAVMGSRTFYTSRTFAEIDMRIAMSDASFAVGAALAGWIPVAKLDDHDRPWIGMKRLGAGRAPQRKD